jgi:hypothetical protein
MSIRKTVLPRNLVILFSVAFTFIALGIFVHGRVFPLQPVDETQLSSVSPQKQIQRAGRALSHRSSAGSELTAHLKQAIVQENHQAAETAASLQRRVAQTKRQLKDAQSIRRQQPNPIGAVNDAAKQQAFAGKIEALKAQLAEMQ